MLPSTTRSVRFSTGAVALAAAGRTAEPTARAGAPREVSISAHWLIAAILADTVATAGTTPDDGGVHGYHDASYGEAFADVYDDWYGPGSDLGDPAVAARFLAPLAAGGRALELGVGTGRLALPLADMGVEVHGVDSSAAMLARLAAKPGGAAVHTAVADMVDGLPAGPFALVFVAYNTLFNLPTEERQQECFRQVAARLASAGGAFVVEAFVPAVGDASADAPSGVSVRSMTATQVVLSVHRSDAGGQRAEGQYVQFTEAGGVRLRPWSIRWATVAQLDEMAASAGLHVAERWADYERTPFGPDSPRHVTVYRR